MSSLAERIEALLPRVSKPARYAGGEYNAVVKPHDTVDLKVAWTFPDAYEVGMSHLGSLIMYQQINKRADSLCERCYAPWPDMEEGMRAESIPLFTLESWTPVNQFDIVAFPLLYELTYTNIFTCLDLAGIPLRSVDRTAADPLVIAGGPCAYNSEPLAPFLDVAVLGDGEQVIHEILDTVKAWKAEGKRNRSDLLLRLAQITGCYVPSLYTVDYQPDGRIGAYRPIAPGVPATVERAIVADLDEVDFPTAPIVPNLEVVFDRAQMEVFRGCSRGCRFCHAGMVNRPVRERSAANVLALAHDLVRNTGHNDLSLVSLSTADYTNITGTVTALSQGLQCDGVNVTLPSTRVDAFSVALADSIQKVHRGSVTLAPEGGSARIRRVINKTVSDQDIRAAFRTAFEAGYRAIKLYFILGLPTEQDEDLAAIVEKAKWALQIADEVLPPQEARRVRVTISVSVFVPKAHTPFQFEPQVRPEEAVRRQQYIKRCLRDRRIEYKYHPSDGAAIEALLSLGDRRVAETLLRVWQMGARFDGWTDQYDHQRWLRACAETGVDVDFYVYRRKGYGEVFAWDHLSTGVTKEWLVDDHLRAMAEEEITDCRWETCDLCGVCLQRDVSPLLKG
ncbi:MAG: TIGR03960 family B12-binding radical SAM protein [Mycobacterium leprae]